MSCVGGIAGSADTARSASRPSEDFVHWASRSYPLSHDPTTTFVLPDIGDDTLDRLELAFDLPIERPGSLQEGSE